MNAHWMLFFAASISLECHVSDSKRMAFFAVLDTRAKINEGNKMKERTDRQIDAAILQTQTAQNRCISIGDSALEQQESALHEPMDS